MNDFRLALQLLTTYKSLGFTEDEIATLCERGGHQLEIEAFKHLYGLSLQTNYQPQSEEEIGHYLGSWAWTLPTDVWPRRTSRALQAQGIDTVGMLQMITEERLADIRGIKKSLHDIKAYMEVKGLRFSAPHEAMRTRTMTIFRRLWRVPVNYFEARTGVHCNFLTDRGVHLVMQLTKIPKARLIAIPGVDPSDIAQIHEELLRLGLTFKSE